MGILNPSKTRMARKETNPEGYEVYSEDADLELFKMASNLKASDTFYKQEDERISAFVDAVRSHKDKEYVKAMAYFLNGIGIKFSPALTYAAISTEIAPNERKLVASVYDRPDKIAVPFGLQGVMGVKIAPTFKKKVLRPALASLSPLMLKKMKMANRAIKTKDLIKLLRPKPRDKQMAALYKAIIEDSAASKLNSSESFVAMKSDSTLDKDIKVEYFVKNIDKIPLNQLIRNLKFYSEISDYKQKVYVKEKIIGRISKLIEEGDDRKLNVFDLITAAMYVPSLGDEIMEICKVFIEKVKEKGFALEGETIVMFDVSGSMDGDAKQFGLKYLALFSLLFDLKDENVYYFANEARKEHPAVIASIRKGYFDKALNYVNRIERGGTAIFASTIEALKDHVGEVNNIVIISDEVTWADDGDIDRESKRLREIFDGNVILINPVHYHGTIFKKKLLAIDALDAKILYYLKFMVDFKGFVSELKKEWKELAK